MSLFQKSAEGVTNWLEERLEISALKKLADKKTVPEHKFSYWYMMGGLLLSLFSLQAITGIVLALYYKPVPEAANQSIHIIMTEVPMGWLMRTLHVYCANAIIIVVFLHMFSTLLLKAYRKPRELTWLTGVGLMGISLVFCFSGYLLPWDTLAFAATRVGTGIPGSLPLGEYITLLGRGGADVTGETLTRFYTLHICLLPLALAGVAVLHILFIQKQGMSIPVSVEQDKEQMKKVRHIPFFPNFTYKESVIWLFVIGIIITLAAVYPAHVGDIADPMAPTPEDIKPEWYFLFAFQFLKLFPSSILGISGECLAVSIMGIAGAAFTFIPFLDRASAQNKPSPVFTWIGVMLITIFLALTLWGVLV